MLNLIVKKYTQLIKQSTQSPSTQSPSTQGLSLILTLLIISSILTGTVLVADIIIRHSQIVMGAEVSEKAFFAAETGVEKASYEILKNYDNISTPYSLIGELDDEAEYTVSALPDTACPNPPTECSADVISNTNPWSITLDAGESFQINLDINGTNIYPATLNIDQDGSVATDLIIYECETTGTPRVCSSTVSQSFIVTLSESSEDLPIDEENNYYKIRINNISASSQETYILTPSGDLPIGIEIRAIGSYSGYERKLVNNSPKWQKFGF